VPPIACAGVMPSPSATPASTTVDAASSVMTTAVWLAPMRARAANVNANAAAVTAP
jgi:hypothetical protein